MLRMAATATSVSAGLLDAPTCYTVLLCALCSLSVDIFVLHTARLCHFETAAEWSAMLAVASSYVTLVYLTHTFSNSIETFLFAALVYLVVKKHNSAG